MTQRLNTRDLVASGCAVGLNALPGLLFDPNCPYRACLICGKVYQTSEDREGGPETKGWLRRKRWADNHARTHTEEEHMQLFMSGLTMTPEAAHLLAAYGLVPFGDMVMNSEVEDALAKASAIPTEDAECSTR